MARQKGGGGVSLAEKVRWLACATALPACVYSRWQLRM
jgi:hypothetical protein